MTEFIHSFYLRTVQTAVLLFVLSIFSVVSFAALDDPEADGLIKAYVTALQSNDIGEIKGSWDDLNNNKDAVEYMHQNMPQLHYLFQVRGLYFQMQAIQAKRSEFFNDKQGAASTVEETAEMLKKDLLPGAAEVAKFSLSDPDVSRARTNGDIVAATQGSFKTDNQAIALGNPNQNRIDNKDFVRNRVESLYGQKFQEVPKELAPRGDVLTKIKLPAEPDIKIKGLFTDVTFKKSSAEERYLTIALNGHEIVGDLKISQIAEYLRIYLEPGINELVISAGEQEGSKEVKNFFVVVNFKKTLQGERKFSLNLPKGSVQILRIEAAP